MQKNSQNFSMEEALRIAKSPAGQALIDALRRNNATSVNDAAARASSGDMRGAQESLSSLLSNPEIQALIRKLGK